FRALVQLFEQGGFSGDVLKELEAGNEGVENFVIRMFLAVHGIGAFFDGLRVGFSKALEVMKPTFQQFAPGLEQLGFSLSAIYDEVNPEVALGQFNEFGATGRSVGKELARVAEFVVKAMTAFVDFGVAIMPAIMSVASLITSLGGVETIVKAVEIALVVMA